MNAFVKWSDEWEAVNEAKKSVPIDLYSLASRLGVTVRAAFLDKKVSGMLEKQGDGYLLTVNALDPETRQRFTIAHELGHFMLHRPLIGDGITDDRAYRSAEDGRYHNSAIGPMHETEANRFAATLLMPVDSIRKDFRELKDVKAMAKRYKVSEQSMSIRLGLPYTP